MSTVFEVPQTPTVPISGSDSYFPVRRIFCVGRNYAAHARELGNDVDREAPIWFTKSPAAICLTPAAIDFPPGTDDCHYEVELVVAINGHGFQVPSESAMAVVYGYACGIDLTRRDLQNRAKAKGYPWDTGKDFENAAIVAPITPVDRFTPGEQHIVLSKNGAARQDAPLSDMIWSLPELIADLSHLYHLAPGDLIFTGTPAGVGPIAAGDKLEGRIDGLEPLLLEINAG